MFGSRSTDSREPKFTIPIPSNRQEGVEMITRLQSTAEDVLHVTEDQKVRVNIQSDIYDAVVVAAFGGVTVTFGKVCVKAHPYWMFLLCIVVGLIQLTSLLYMRLDQDLLIPVHAHNEDTYPFSIITYAKCLMIVVLQLMLFPELMEALQILFFVLNPTTWIDIERREHGWMWHATLLAPFACLATMLKITVAYLVLSDSISMILSVNTVQDCIFNCLALTFLTDLDVTFWSFARSVFHLDSFETFTFNIVSDDERERAAEDAWITLKKNCCLRRGHGGATIENIITYAILMWIYLKQFLVTAWALHTDILPIARDMCALFWLTSEDTIKGTSARFALSVVSLNLHPHVLLNDQCNPANGGYCNEGYERTRMSDMIVASPILTVTGASLIALVLLGPQFVELLVVKLHEHGYCGAGDSSEYTEAPTAEPSLDPHGAIT